MMKLIRKEAFITAFSLFCTGTVVFAQQKNPKYEFGAGVGFVVYQGDLTPEQLGSFRTLKPAVGFYVSRILGPSFSLRTNLAYGHLHGDDARYSFPEYRQQRNFNFTSPVLEVSELLVWNAAGKNYDDKGFSPYLFAGAGLSFLNIKRDWSKINTKYFLPESSEIWAGLAADSVHSLPHIIPVIPVGAGIRYGITSSISVFAESSYRLSFTDYIDGFSRAANPTKRDHYYINTIGLVYHPDRKSRLNCPAIHY
jgi:hypothetical protein